MSKKKPLPKKPYNKGVEELGIPSTQHNADLIAHEIEKKEVEKHNEAVEAELRGEGANKVVVDEVQVIPADSNMSDKLASILEAHNKDGTRDLIWGPDLELEPPAEHIEDEVTNKVVLEQAIEKLELTNTSPYAANIQEIKVSEDFSREAINELGRIAPYMGYDNFLVEVTEPIVLHNTSGGTQGDDCNLPEDILDDIGYTYESPKLPPVNTLVAPKTVKAIEQAPVVNNGGTITPQVPQAQPVGRQRHTFKARPDKEGRNV